jgi:hypothetical protein
MTRRLVYALKLDKNKGCKGRAMPLTKPAGLRPLRGSALRASCKHRIPIAKESGICRK